MVAALALMAFAISACVGQAENSSNSQGTASASDGQVGFDSRKEGTDEQTAIEDGKVLVAYFSVTGNTKGIAEHVCQATDGTLFEIVPTEPYTTEDLNYNDPASRTSLERTDSSVRPGIAAEIEDWDSYEIVFIGYPIWWGDAPAIMETFAESYDWNGKTVVAFCTSNSSGFGSSDSVLKNATPGATWLTGQRFGEGASASEVEAWVDGLNLGL